jgi:hypothetical protein
MTRMPQVTAHNTGGDIGQGFAVRILEDAGFSVEDFLRLR